MAIDGHRRAVSLSSPMFEIRLDVKVGTQEVPEAVDDIR